MSDLVSQSECQNQPVNECVEGGVRVGHFRVCVCVCVCVGSLTKSE